MGEFFWFLLGMAAVFYVLLVIPNQQRMHIFDRYMETIDKAIDAGLITKEEFEQKMKELTKEFIDKKEKEGATITGA